MILATSHLVTVQLNQAEAYVSDVIYPLSLPNPNALPRELFGTLPVYACHVYRFHDIIVTGAGQVKPHPYNSQYAIFCDACNHNTIEIINTNHPKDESSSFVEVFMGYLDNNINGL